MTRTERTIVLHWRGIATVCAIVALFGISYALWHRIDASERNYAEAVAEADLRGEAVSTLVGDVRALRQQIEAEGATPVAPDPAKAVEDLPDRVEVPVPIPGPRGLTGSPGPSGPSGSPGAAGNDGVDGSPGAIGVPGAVGPSGPTGPVGPQGEQGAAGVQGEQGPQGERGERGPAGQSCPEGFSWQTPSYDPDARVCRRDGAPDPSESPSPVVAAGLDPRRLQYV